MQFAVKTGEQLFYCAGLSGKSKRINNSKNKSEKNKIIYGEQLFLFTKSARSRIRRNPNINRSFGSLEYIVNPAVRFVVATLLEINYF